MLQGQQVYNKILLNEICYKYKYPHGLIIDLLHLDVWKCIKNSDK